MPLYPLYAVLFAATGLTDAEISALFAIWSVVGVVAEVPTGALADRFSRRHALVAAGVLQAAGYLLWTVFPGFAAFAAGFVLWGLGGTLVSGALEALLYDGLAAAGARDQFARVYGQVNALSLVAQIPSAAAATVLFSLGGFGLVGWASVGTCLVAAVIASKLPESPRAVTTEDGSPGYLATVRAGLAELMSRPAVRGAVVAVALLTSVDALEEYFPLLARDWHVPTAWIPLAVVGIPLAGAVGAALAGRLNKLSPAALAVLVAAAASVLAVVGVAGHPAGLVGLAVFYAGYRAVLVVAGARLQDRIQTTSRATVTSLAGLGTDVASLALYAAWAAGGLLGVAVLTLLVAAVLPYGLRGRYPVRS